MSKHAKFITTATVFSALLLAVGTAYADETADATAAPPTTDSTLAEPAAAAQPEADQPSTTATAYASPLQAPHDCEPVAPPAPKQSGFLLRLQGGPSYIAASGEPDTSLDSFGGALLISVGHELTKGFALHLDGSLSSAFAGNFSANGTEEDEFNVVLQSAGFGLGASVLFPEVGLYIAPSIGFAWANTTAYKVVDDRTTVSGSETSRVGPMVSLTVGKEWGIGHGWGVGLSLAYQYQNVPGADGQELTLSHIHTFGPRFSATFGP